MKKVIVLIIIILLIGTLCIYFLNNREKNIPATDDKNGVKVNINNSQTSDKTIQTERQITNMKIFSPAFQNQTMIPEKYSCHGENINPPLVFEDVPAQTKSLALVMDDPDAPSGTFVHWILWNINSKTNEIAENSVPSGAIQGQNSSGRQGYMGPCPPSGTHRYFFKLHALDSQLELPPSSSISDLQNQISKHLITSAEFFGVYTQK